MSTARRAYDVLRGYVNYGWDSLRGPEETDAARELREAVEQPIRPVRVERPNASPGPEPSLSVESCRTLFDLRANATTKQIDEAFRSLAATADPAKFPEGSEARERAVRLQRRITVARQVLIDNLDPTVRRFEGLEIGD